MASSTKLKRWFDHLDSILSSEAALAGLLGHATMVGASREFVVRRVLRSFLPSSIHVGSGRIISGLDDAESKQIDVVVYDPRFPFLEITDGVGLYFVEGVIATIEVKSTLKSDTLQNAVENCLSVSQLRVRGQDVNERAARVAEIAQRRGLDEVEAAEVFERGIRPSTYVFAFSSDMSAESVSKMVQSAPFDSRFNSSRRGPPHPSVIISPNVIGLADDGTCTLNPSEMDRMAARELSGPEARIVMGFWDAKKPFGLFACHLMAKVSRRLGTFVWGDGVSLALDKYLPIAEYTEEIMLQRDVKWIVWHPHDE